MYKINRSFAYKFRLCLQINTFSEYFYCQPGIHDKKHPEVLYIYRVI